MTTRVAAKKGIQPERLIDLVPFFIGFDAYVKWLEETGGTPDAFLQRGAQLARKYMRPLNEGIQLHIEPITQRPDAAILKPALTRSNKSGTPTERAQFKAEFLKKLFWWLRSHQEVARRTFAGKAHKATIPVIRLQDQDHLPALVAQAAGIPAVSGLQVPRKWLAAAAERMGAALSSAEVAMVDVESAANIATRIGTLDAKLAAADPGSERSATLVAEREALLAKMEENAGGDPSILHAAAAAAFEPNTGHQTKTGQKLSLNTQQEAAMVADGKKVVAAGAGSGKTRVLAGEVAYRINEMGYDASSIMAVSFTRKSSKELTLRASKYGAVLDGAARDGFGTTHYIAGVTILGKHGEAQKRPKYFSKKQNWAVTSLVALAAKQVGMQGGEGKEAPTPRNAFTDAEVPVPGTTAETPVPDFKENANIKAFLDAMGKAADFYEFGWPATWKGGTWARTQLSIIVGIAKNVAQGNLDPADISPQNRAKLEAALDRAKIRHKFGNEGEPADVEVPEADGPDIVRKGMAKYTYFTKPAGMWFNLGHRWEGSGDKGGKEGAKFSASAIKRRIDIWKGMGVTPEEVWYAAGAAEGKVDKPYMPEAAAYAAYEWLKGTNGEPDFRNTGDMNDLLLDATRCLVHNDEARGALQSRFKVILVDEAQDLNRCVSGDTEVQTPDGPKLVRDLDESDHILSFENGQVVFNKVTAKVKSSWTRGYKVTTESGRTLTMSPDHKVYATPIKIPKGSLALYLMHREGLGFRIGTSKRLFRSTSKGSAGRAQAERADCAWVLEIGEPREMLFKEAALSLEKGIPTLPYEAEVRGCDQERTERIFATFGENGRALLEQYDLDFNRPHWTTTSCTRGRFNRFVVNLQAHRNSGAQRGSKVGLNWTGETPDGVHLPVYQLSNDRKMVNKLLTSYTQAAEDAARLAHQLGARVNETLAFAEHSLPLVTASALHAGMAIPAWGCGVDLRFSDLLPISEYRELARRLEVDIAHLGGKQNTGKIEIHKFLREIQQDRGFREVLPAITGSTTSLDTIEMVEPVDHNDFWDISVEKAANFFGNGLLSHNCQHVLFSLLAGAIDPKTLQPTEEMTADTFGFIGDDKQAIYEFRGAEPDEFIDKSDLVPGGQDYETHVLDTNYRSGQAIVEAANQLIKHNTKQIPMTCKANYEVKGDGAITAETFGGPEEAADMVADTIADYAEANATADAKYSNYGIAVRSNAEAMHYALGMVKKGIPFKSKANPFKSPPIKAMIGWMSFVEHGPTMTRADFLKATKDAIRIPASFLGKAFLNKLESQENPLGWLKDMDPFKEFRGNYAKRVVSLLDNLGVCFRFHADPKVTDPNEIYNRLLAELKSAEGDSFFQTIVNNIKENNGKMAELAAENPDGIPTAEQINEAAEEELVLLEGLMGSKPSVVGVMDYVRELKAVNEKVAAGEDDNRDAVIIGTMHSWKGLEVPKLFMPLVRGKFPRAKLKKGPGGKMECENPDKDDPALASERRLAYVAITRAEDSCVLMDIINPSKAFADCSASQFIEEACVQFRGSDAASVEDEEDWEEHDMARMGSDPLLEEWQEPEWPDDPEDAEFDDMLAQMDDQGLEEPGDEMLAEWFKTTENLHKSAGGFDSLPSDIKNALAENSYDDDVEKVRARSGAWELTMEISADVPALDRDLLRALNKYTLESDGRWILTIKKKK
jgi:superfamily I DNA/RNA helicase